MQKGKKDSLLGLAPQPWIPIFNFILNGDAMVLLPH